MEFLAVFLLILLFVLFFASFWLKNSLKVLNTAHNPDELVIGNGQKLALIIYQPTKHKSASGMANVIADCLSEKGYTVKINYPSNQLDYNLSEYDLLVFGSGVYFGRVSPVLTEFIMKNSLKNKSVLIYTVGSRTDDLTDLSELKILFDNTNFVRAIKVAKGQEEKLKKFVCESVD